jgi:cell division protease FtsH
MIYLITMFFNKKMPEAEEKVSSDLYADLAKDRVKRVDVNNRRVTVTLYPVDENEPTKYTFSILGERDASSIVNALHEHNAPLPDDKQVKVATQPESRLLAFLLTVVAPTAILLLLLYFIFFRSMSKAGGSGVLTFGKSRARIAGKGQVKVTFDDVAGIEEAKQDVKEIIEFLSTPDKFREIGARIPRGVLLVGAPGTGKTLLAKAIAGEADVPFFSISGSDFVEMFVGVGASRVRDLFRQAKENAPCIIFLDEIDAVGRKRGTTFTGGGHDEREQTLNAILVEMDGFESDQNVVVVAATNRPDVLDPALRRPGRFDRQVVVDLPDVKGREEILEVHARKVKLGEGVELEVLARGTPSFTGADLEAIINEAAILAALAGHKSVTMEELEEARDKVRWGRQRRSRVMAQEDKRITAYHESGHAVATKLLPEVEPLHKVTIIPRGMALGATMHLPEKDRYHVQQRELMGEIVALLAGRVAEEMFCDDISSGARDDIRRATALARYMVREWGMSGKLGPVFYGEEQSEGGFEPMIVKPYSESIAVEIDTEVKLIIEDCYNRARQLLTKNREAVKRVADALLEKEVLEGADVEALMGQAAGSEGAPDPGGPPAGEPEA